MSCDRAFIRCGLAAAVNGISTIGSKAAATAAMIGRDKTFRSVTRGPRAVLSYRRACLQAQGRVAGALGAFTKEVIEAERTFGRAERAGGQKFNAAEAEFRRVQKEGAGQQKVGITPGQVIAGAGAYAVGTGLSGGNAIIGVAAAAAATGAARELQRRAQWNSTPEGEAAWQKLEQADEEAIAGADANAVNYKQSMKRAGKKLAGEVNGARQDLEAGRKVAGRTLLTGE